MVGVLDITQMWSLRSGYDSGGGYGGTGMLIYTKIVTVAVRIR